MLFKTIKLPQYIVLFVLNSFSLLGQKVIQSVKQRIKNTNTSDARITNVSIIKEFKSIQICAIEKSITSVKLLRDYRSEANASAQEDDFVGDLTLVLIEY
jgi:uncharacterized membrane protein